MIKLIAGVALLSLAAVGCNNVPVANTADGGGEGPFPDFDAGLPFVGPQPVFGPTVSAATPPPALSGGTLLMLADGKTAMAADPDRDQVYLVDLATAKLSATVALTAGDEPGRAVEDAAGKLHVVLRHAGVVATIDPATAAVSARTSVCPAPRGIAYEAASDLVHVACAGGELISLPAGGGAAVRTVTLERDLRDVVVVGAQLWVSTFRTAQIIVLDANGVVARRIALPHSFDFQGEFSPSVAWRMQSLPDGHVSVVHQQGLVGTVQTTHGGYGGGNGGGGCGGIVQSAVSMIDGASTASSSLAIGSVVLPVDLAFDSKSGTFAVVSTGNAHTPGLGQILRFTTSIVIPGSPDMGGPDGGMDGGGGCIENNFGAPVDGEAVALAYDTSGALWVQTREPATLQKLDQLNANTATVKLSTDSRADTGWAVFHSNSGASIA
ncbi:MAG: YncE family protein, partial [Polyangia bacterium]